MTPPNFSIDLTGQTALVTGASSGLGLRFARVLTAAGAKVALAARRTDRLEALAGEIAGAGGTATVIPLDVTDAEQIFAAVGETQERLGLVTILVNNAGIPDAQYATKMSVDLVDRVLGVNVRGPWFAACEVARRLIAAKSPGRIVNIASMAAYETNGPGSALYSVTKAAVVRMTEALSVEWAPFHINVNGIAPGAFATEMLDGMIQRIGDITPRLPRKRIGDPAQLDSTLLYLVSPSSTHVTGTVIKVDDGQSGR